MCKGLTQILAQVWSPPPPLKNIWASSLWNVWLFSSPTICLLYLSAVSYSGCSSRNIQWGLWDWTLEFMHKPRAKATSWKARITLPEYFASFNFLTNKWIICKFVLYTKCYCHWVVFENKMVLYTLFLLLIKKWWVMLDQDCIFMTLSIKWQTTKCNATSADSSYKLRKTV